MCMYLFPTEWNWKGIRVNSGLLRWAVMWSEMSETCVPACTCVCSYKLVSDQRVATTIRVVAIPKFQLRWCTLLQVRILGDIWIKTTVLDTSKSAGKSHNKVSAKLINGQSMVEYVKSSANEKACTCSYARFHFHCSCLLYLCKINTFESMTYLINWMKILII